MAVNRNYSNTAVATTLTAGINNSAVTLTVASATGYPVVPFTIVVDVGTTTEELMTVTAVSGTTFTVTRGVDGTTGATHALGASVKHAFSARDIREAQEHLDPATVATHGATGAIVGTTNVQTLTNKTLTAPTVTDITGAARGTLGYASITADVSMGAGGDVTGLSVTVTAGTSRRLKISVCALVEQTTTTYHVVEIQQAGVTIGTWWSPSPVANNRLPASPSIVVAPAAGAHTFNVQVTPNSGTLIVRASATMPSFILVEDIGNA